MEQSEPSEEPLPAIPVPPETASPEGDLPDWEPLSPELLEDEAIRGDFVLRWAVVGLALLFGCSQLTDARPLVHVRSGEWLAAHGGLPTGQEPFSIAGADRRWVNLNWLFDLLAAGVHAVAGPIGTSILQGVLALAAFALLGHACRWGIRTWWGSVCATLALLAAMPRLNATPELITLCGLAGCLWLLVRCEERRNPADGWWFVPMLWVWSQMDPRAWIGAALLVLYALGGLISRRSAIDLATAATPSATAPSVPKMWKPIGVAVIAMAVHPFLWETWLSPIQLYGVEYPALRAAYPRPVIADLAWYPLWSPLLWNQPDFRLAAGLLLAVAAAATLWLNRPRVTWSHLLMYLGANAIGAAAWHDFPVAAVVNCTLATIHGQGWYLARFGQVYSISWPEVLFSRGGRALTVASLFALAWLAISGRIDGPDGRRSGVGLDRQLLAELDSFHQLPALAADDRGFHMTLRQGDALIATGRKSFVDHRVRLFAGRGDADLLARHHLTRLSMRRPRPNDPLSITHSEWKDTFIDYQLSHVLPRLTLGVSGPDYDSLLDLLSNPEWKLTEILPGTAVLHWARSPEPAVHSFLVGHELNLLEKAFRKPEPANDQPRAHPLPATWSQQLFSLPRRNPSGSTMLASHWMRLAASTSTAPWPFRVGCVTVAVRAAQAGVQETPDVASAYSMLAHAYSLLARLESMPLADTGLPWNTSLRYYQAIAAARDAARLDPSDLAVQSLLLDLYQSAGRIDAAQAAVEAIVDQTPISIEPQDLERRERMLNMADQLRSATAQLMESAQQQLDQGVDRLQIASALFQNGAVQRTADLLREDAVYVERTPAARQLLTAALAELGAGPELDESASRLEAIGEVGALVGWRDSVALAALGRADYAAAARQWDQAIVTSNRDQLQALLYTAPLTTASPIWLGDLGFPSSHAGIVLDAYLRRPHIQALTEFNRAACELERANVEGAKSAFQRALARAPESPLRPLLRVYLFCLTDNAIDAEPPSDWIPITADMFAKEE